MIWRRRIVALLILLALAAGVVWGVSALVRTLTAQGAEEKSSTSSAAAGASGGSGSAAETATDSSSSSAAEEEERADAGPVDPEGCSPRDLDVTMNAEQGDGATTFTLSLSNGADVPCLVDAGAGSLVLTVHSGEDRVWSSDDCAAEPAERKLLLDAGDSTETAVRWDGARSAQGCRGEQGTAQPGSYRVSASLDGASLPAATTTFTLG